MICYECRKNDAIGNFEIRDNMGTRHKDLCNECARRYEGKSTITKVKGYDENNYSPEPPTSYIIEQRGLREKFQNERPKLVAVYSIQGNRGRRIEVYEDRVVITTDVTLGSLFTSNATDGEKTIFYSDIIGVQYKTPGATIGYLQLETASGQMNNSKSNQFGENTFTFDTLTGEIQEMKEYVLWQISRRKK